MERPSPFPHIRHLSSGNPWEFEHDPELKMDGDVMPKYLLEVDYSATGMPAYKTTVLLTSDELAPRWA
jgi:hypothetical protein